VLQDDIKNMIEGGIASMVWLLDIFSFASKSSHKQSNHENIKPHNHTIPKQAQPHNLKTSQPPTHTNTKAHNHTTI
jgi:hypothetical protein